MIFEKKSDNAWNTVIFINRILHKVIRLRMSIIERFQKYKRTIHYNSARN